MFYLTTHSTHFIYGYMASDIWLRTILIVRKETRCRYIGYSFRLTARVLLYTPSHRQDSTYIFVTPVVEHWVEREIAQWVDPGQLKCNNMFYNLSMGAGCSSVDSMPAFEAVGRRIDPSQWTQLQFGLFSVPTSGPQLVYQRPWYVLFCLWKSAYKRSLAAYRKE